MRSRFVTLTVSTFLLAFLSPATHAETYPDGSAARREQLQQRFERGPSDRYDPEDEYEDDRRRSGRAWGEGRRPGMPVERRSGMMDDRQSGAHQRGPAFGSMAMIVPGFRGAGLMEMMMVLMDSDGDGGVSLQEFLAGHERIFKAMDTDKDGRLTLEELRSYRPGSRNNPRR